MDTPLLQGVVKEIFKAPLPHMERPCGGKLKTHMEEGNKHGGKLFAVEKEKDSLIHG